MRGLRGTVLPVAIGLFLLLGTIWSTRQVHQFNQRAYLHTSLYLPSGKFVEQMSLGYELLAADMIWAQAVQYYGGYRSFEHDLAYFDGLLDIVTDLDEHFIFPYIFGAVVMAQDMGELDKGVALLKKGMVRNPDNWRLPFEIGFNTFLAGGDRRVAAQYFELASRLPGGGDRARRFAAFLYSKSGHAETSIRMWEELKESTDEPYMRELAERYIAKIKRGELRARK